MILNVQLITANDCIPLRSLVLRPGKPLTACAFPEDPWQSSFHLGVVADGKIICVGSFLQIPLVQFPDARNPYQLRGMATHPDSRGLGAGSEILNRAEAHVKDRGGNLLWFNARKSAFAFYEKCGYSEVDGIITISDYGPHKLMFKKLRS